MVAPRILWRYILRDVALHSLLGLFVFTVVLVAQNVLGYMEDLLAADVSAGALVRLVAMVLPSYQSYAIPTSLLFGVLLTFGRMSEDGEVVALRAAGVSVTRLLPPVLAVGALCVGLTGYVQFELEPRSHYQLKSFVRELGRTTKVVEPGRFRIVGTRTVYVTEAGDATCPYRGVLIGDLSDAPRPLFILAQCASLDPDASSGLALDLWRGAIHFSDADTERYRKISFQSMKIALDLEDIVYTAKKPRDYTLAELLDLKQRFARGQTPEIRGGNGERTVDTQIHRRFAFPMASMVLAVLAVPLGIRPLRTGRSAGAITAIGVMALYWCGFAAGELASERGLVPAWLGIWMPNVLVVALSIALIRATIRGDS